MRGQFWRSFAAVLLVAAPVSATAQTAAKPPAVSPSIPPLTPSQQAAVLLGRWETCVDLAAQFLAYSALGTTKSVANVERKCSDFENELRPVLRQSLTEMMYGSSEEQVAEQSIVAIESLRRHIHARALAAVRARRARK